MNAPAGIFNFISSKIGTKIVLMLLAFGLVPALAVFGLLYSQKGVMQSSMRARLAGQATRLADTIDRNLFERYGDVQAFGLNTAAHDPANWGKPGADNPLIGSINGYMTNYGLYRLMLVMDASGKVVAVNSVDPKGNALATEKLYGMSFADAAWFKKPMAGEFLKGANGLTGTAVGQPAATELVGGLYGDDGYTLVFSAPVKDASGKTIGVWANFADFGLVEEIAGAYYKALADGGMASGEVTLLAH